MHRQTISGPKLKDREEARLVAIERKATSNKSLVIVSGFEGADVGTER